MSVSQRFVLKNKLAEIGEVLDQFARYAADQQLSDALRRKLAPALDDLLNNIISYAYTDANEHTIDSLAMPLLQLE